jgi:hypothetical protein
MAEAMKRQGWAVAVGVAVLLALVAAASRTQLFHESEPPLAPGVSRLVVDFSLYLFLVLELLVGALVIWALWPRDEYSMPEIKRPPWWHLLIQYAMLAAVFALGVLFAARIRRLLFDRGTPPPGQSGSAASNRALGAASVPNTPPGFDWLAFGLVVLLLAAVALLWWQRMRRRRLRRGEEREIQRALAEVLGDALDDLRTDTDPRRAVIQAYARMERVLAVHRVPRRPHEVPLEYLSRALAELDIREPAIRRLTELYEFARFSQHEVDEAMRADALESLAAIRENLLAQAPDPAPLGQAVAT